MRATSASNASCVTGAAKRNRSNSFNAIAAALRIFATRALYLVSNSFPVSECMQVFIKLRSHDWGLNSRTTDQLPTRRGHSCENNRLSVPCAEVEIEHCELAFFDGKANTDVSLPVRSGYNHIRSSRQCH